MQRLALLLGTCVWCGCHIPDEVCVELRSAVSSDEPAVLDPLVHCHLDEGGRFLRESRCAEFGGRVDEPEWARIP